jgi:hypothetical protein
MRKFRLIAGLLLAVAVAVPVAYAAGFITNGLPVAGGTQYPSTYPLTGNEQAPFDTMLPGGLNPASEAITVAQLKATILGLPSVVLADTPTTAVPINANLGSFYTLTLTSNSVLATPTNLTPGQSFRLELIQDGTGSRTLTYPTGGIYWWSGGTAPTLSTTPGAIDLLKFDYDGTVLLGTSTLNFLKH